MQKAMFLIESYRKGILEELNAGYILTVNVPDINDIQRKLNPFRIEMISYNGVKSIQQIDNRLQFMSSGKKIFCLIEPARYPKKYVEPAMRNIETTEQIPFRFKECEMYFTFDNKYRILLPQNPIICYDSFTVEFPPKGDICVIYFIYNDNINDIVLPSIKQNVEMIFKKIVGLPGLEAKKIAGKFIENVKIFDTWDD